MKLSSLNTHHLASSQEEYVRLQVQGTSKGDAQVRPLVPQQQQSQRAKNGEARPPKERGQISSASRGPQQSVRPSIQHSQAGLQPASAAVPHASSAASSVMSSGPDRPPAGACKPAVRHAAPLGGRSEHSKDIAEGYKPVVKRKHRKTFNSDSRIQH